MYLLANPLWGLEPTDFNAYPVVQPSWLPDQEYSFYAWISTNQRFVRFEPTEFRKKGLLVAGLHGLKHTLDQPDKSLHIHITKSTSISTSTSLSKTKLPST